MVDGAAAASVGWGDYMRIDARVLGIVGWAGLLPGVVSLAVTVAVFVIALRQIQAVSEASRKAAGAMMEALKRRDVTANLDEAKSHLRLASVLM